NPLEQRSWRWTAAGNVKRARVSKHLAASGGRHLVFVRYSRAHDPGDEWVYNDAEIDAAPMVWARELDRASNRALMSYYAGRQVWLVEPDASSIEPVAYEKATPQPMPFVQLGAPGIAVLRDPARVKEMVLGQPGTDDVLTCDRWNFAFTQATEVAGPEV